MDSNRSSPSQKFCLLKTTRHLPISATALSDCKKPPILVLFYLKKEMKINKTKHQKILFVQKAA